jgi:hypothetical protein
VRIAVQIGLSRESVFKLSPSASHPLAMISDPLVINSSPSIMNDILQWTGCKICYRGSFRCPDCD